MLFCCYTSVIYTGRRGISLHRRGNCFAKVVQGKTCNSKRRGHDWTGRSYKCGRDYSSTQTPLLNAFPISECSSTVRTSLHVVCPGINLLASGQGLWIKLKKLLLSGSSKGMRRSIGKAMLFPPLI